MTTDLTVGHPRKTLWRFLLPMLVSVMFQQFYNIADSMIAGRFAGENALAAVGASYPITVIFMAFALSLIHIYPAVSVLRAVSVPSVCWRS